MDPEEFLPPGPLTWAIGIADTPNNELARRLAVPDWKTPLGAIVKQSMAPRVPQLTKNTRTITMPDGQQFLVETPTAHVLETLAKYPAGLSKDELGGKSGHPDARRVLARLLKAHPELKPYVHLPGARGKGGYRAEIEVKD